MHVAYITDDNENITQLLIYDPLTLYTTLYEVKSILRIDDSDFAHKSKIKLAKALSILRKEEK